MIDQNTVAELKQGYQFDEKAKCYACLHCGATYPRGQVFELDGKFFEATAAVEQHMATAHNGPFEALLANGGKTGLTEVQTKLLRAFYSGKPNAKIAQDEGISPSTVRQQRFQLRERARQARLFLSLYELMLARQEGGEEGFPVHAGATMVDERYNITQDEAEEIRKAVYESREPLRLATFPAKQKRKLVVLHDVAQQFPAGEQFTEKQVNAILEAIYDDYVTLRRYLIEYGFLDRKNDGSAYWRKEQ